MKTIRILLLCILNLLGSLSVLAYDFEVDGIFYTISSKDSTEVEVVAKYEPFYDWHLGILLYYPTPSYVGSMVIPTEVSFKDRSYQVTSVGHSAFNGCTDLTSIDLGNVTAVGDSVFWECYKLTSVDFGNVSSIGDYAFGGCTGLTSVDFGNVSSIGNYAFSGCTGLTSVDFGNVSSIGNHAFGGCTGLTSIDFGKVSSIGDFAFSECRGLVSVDLGNVSSLGNFVFDDCSKLVSIDFRNVSSMGKHVFYGCSELVSVNLGNLTAIGEGAFSGCSKLERVEQKQVVTIGNEAFASCWKLSSADFPKVDSIGNRAFYCCSQLPSFDLRKVRYLGWGAFESCSSLSTVHLGEIEVLPNDIFEYCKALSSIDLSHVTQIGGGAFLGCENLKSVDLRNTKSIGGGAFQNCSRLSIIENTDNITHIGSYCFIRTPWLDQQPDGIVYLGAVACVYKGNMAPNTHLVLRDDIKSIADDAFYGCTELQGIDLKNVEVIGSMSFEGCSNLVDIDLSSVKEIGHQAFQDCRSLESIDLKNAEVVGGHAFTRCSKLSKVYFNKLKKIEYSFIDCINLHSVDFKNVETIGSSAFQNCSGLKSIDLEQVKTVGWSAFENCDLTYIKVSSVVPAEIEGENFDEYEFNNATLRVPINCKHIYETAEVWSNFKNIVEYELLSYPVFISTNEGGNIVVNGESFNDDEFSVDIEKGREVILEIKPSTGFKLQQMVINGNDVTSEVNGLSYRFFVDNFTEIKVVFERVAANLIDQETIYDMQEDLLLKEAYYTRQFNDTEWQALYLPFSMNYADWASNFQLARISDTRQYDDNNDGYVDRTVLEAFILPEGSHTEANTPYIIKAKTVGEKVIRVGDVLLKKAEIASIDCSSVDYRYVITGTYKGISGEEMFNKRFYAMSDGCLQQASTTVPLSGFRWYLSVENRNGNQVFPSQKIMLMVFDENGEISGVEELDMPESKMWPANIYDIQGKLVKANAEGMENLPKGIYIVNGKKIIK